MALLIYSLLTLLAVIGFLYIAVAIQCLFIVCHDIIFTFMLQPWPWSASARTTDSVEKQLRPVTAL